MRATSVLFFILVPDGGLGTGNVLFEGGLVRAIYCGTETWDRDKYYRLGNEEWAL